MTIKDAVRRELGNRPIDPALTKKTADKYWQGFGDATLMLILVITAAAGTVAAIMAAI